MKFGNDSIHEDTRRRTKNPSGRKVGFVVAVALGLTLFVGANQQSANRNLQFTDIAAQAGLTQPIIYGGLDSKRYIIETNGCGVAFYDYDDDGWMDVLTLSGTTLEQFRDLQGAAASASAPTTRLYKNNRNGTFTDVTAKAGFTHTGFASGLCIGDFDGDGFDDLFVTYFGANVLYRNHGNGTFTDVTKKAGLSFSESIRWGSGCSFIDYDRDGDLDLFVANYLSFDLKTATEPGKGANCAWKGVPVNCGPKGLPFARNWFYRNNGDGTFTDVSEASGIGKVTGRYPMSVAAADFDEDGWIDLYAACDSTASILYRNNTNGTFTDVALESGAAYNEDGQPQAGMGLAIGDFNRDGRLDIFKTHFMDDTPVLYRNSGKGMFEDVTLAAGFGSATKYISWGAGMPDVDNDGWPDVFWVTGNVYPEVEKVFKQYPHRSPRQLYRGIQDEKGNGRFEDVSTQSGAGVTTPHSSRGCAFGDFDNDGDVDVLVMNMNEPPSLLRNDQTTGNQWLKVKLMGAKANRTALGARVIVTIGERKQVQAVLSQTGYYSHDDLRLHFGLGDKTKADRVDVYWPSGKTSTFKDVNAAQILMIKE